MARYKLMGYEIEGHDANQVSVPLGEQRKDALEAKTIVYETDDFNEAKTIQQAGGFFRNRDQFVTVTMLVDSDTEEVPRDQPDTPFFRPSTFPQKG